MKRYCLALDLKDDPKLISEYETYHRAVWPEILKSITDSGILHMEIYRTGNRLFMIMETTDDFSFDPKAQSDCKMPKCRNGKHSCGNINRHCPMHFPVKNGN